MTKSIFKDPNFQRALKNLDDAEKDWSDQNVFSRKVKLIGIDLTHERFGLCHFSKIRLLRDDQEVYRIEKEGETRMECFYYLFAREYQEDKFSFCEYCDAIGLLNRLPTPEEIVEGVGPQIMAARKSSMQGTSIDHVRMYESFARRMLSVTTLK